MQRRSVLLPLPLGPITQTTSPWRIAMLMPRSTSSEPKLLWTSWRARIGPPASACSIVRWLVPWGASMRSPARLGLLAGDQPVDDPRERDRDDDEHHRAERERRAVEGLRLHLATRSHDLHVPDHLNQRRVLHERR